MNCRIHENLLCVWRYYILFIIYLLLRTVKTAVKRNVKNLRLFSTREESKNRIRIKIYFNSFVTEPVII